MTQTQWTPTQGKLARFIPTEAGCSSCGKPWGNQEVEALFFQVGTVLRMLPGASMKWLPCSQCGAPIDDICDVFEVKFTCRSETYFLCRYELVDPNTPTRVPSLRQNENPPAHQGSA